MKSFGRPPIWPEDEQIWCVYEWLTTDISQRELAERLGCSITTVSRWVGKHRRELERQIDLGSLKNAHITGYGRKPQD